MDAGIKYTASIPPIIIGSVTREQEYLIYLFPELPRFKLDKN